ncbi:hypothetical protein LguiA_028032 [Lonicera macranthoides]
MAAKLLHSLTDDNPDLQKQIGCMTGVFQLFDRHQVLAGGRITSPSPKRLPSGSSHFSSRTSEAEFNYRHHQPPVIEKPSNKSPFDKPRASTESSRASFSSSSRSSSFSSLDCIKTAQPDHSSFDQIIYPETPSRDPLMNQSSASPQFGRQMLDLRDVVKDSMYREARGLSVNTKMKEASDRFVNHRDSPRPPQLPKTTDGAYSTAPNGKQNVLNKLREAPWYFDEPRELSRSSSYNLRNASSFTVPKDAPRFSYDGREGNRLSFESRDNSKPALKLKELPRLSLDSRDNSLHNFNSDSKYNFLSSNSGKDSSGSKAEVPSLKKTQTRPPSVVAKLMGLEALPDSVLASENKTGLIKNFPLEDYDQYSSSSKTTAQISNSSKNLWKEPTSPHWKNNDSSMKPISRFPIEPAPWRQLYGTQGSQKPAQKPASRHLKAPSKPASPFPSVYCEIEKRLSDLEFTQSGKDLRALKQILEAMQAKGLLETRKEGEDSNFASPKEHDKKCTSAIQQGRLVNPQKQQADQIMTSTTRGTSSSRNSESSIVIMKPAKLVEKSGIHAKDQIHPKTNRRDNAFNSTDMRTNSRNIKMVQTSTRPQHLSKESTTISVKSSGSTSPRLQQKRIELEKRSRLPTPSSDSSKARRQPNKQQTESSSPGGRRRPKSSSIQQSDEQCSEISSETRNLSYQENQISSGLKIDIEVTSMDRSGEMNGSQSPSIEASEYSVSGSVQKKSTPSLSEDESLVEIAPEYPSPVSVLDDVAYIDDSPSPLKQMPNTLKVDGTRNSNDNKEEWNPTDNHVSNTLGSNLTSEINRQKLQNIENLVQKLRRLNSGHDETRTDYIASLCENTNPDHRYISEILLASGLLLRDLGSSLTTFQFHSSGHPINPELFLVLEQTKASTKPTEHGNVVELKPEKEKFHRKLIFDATNEILGGKLKLACVGPNAEPWLRPGKIIRKTLNAQKLLRELCVEIEQFNANKPEYNNLEEEEEDGLKSLFWEDVMCRAESWTDFDGEISGVVLDVERSIFKDLVGEIVMGEAAGLGVKKKQGRRCRQLFVK